LLLDIWLPLNQQSPYEKAELGFRVLDFARENGSARQILAVSGHPGEREKAFRGLEDWVDKPVTQEKLNSKFFPAWRNVITIECQELRHRRLRHLLPQAQYFSTSRFGKLFSELLQGAGQSCHGLRRLLPERLMIDFERDRTDPITQEIKRLE